MTNKETTVDQVAPGKVLYLVVGRIAVAVRVLVLAEEHRALGADTTAVGVILINYSVL